MRVWITPEMHSGDQPGYAWRNNAGPGPPPPQEGAQGPLSIHQHPTGGYWGPATAGARAPNNWHDVGDGGQGNHRGNWTGGWEASGWLDWGAQQRDHGNDSHQGQGSVVMTPSELGNIAQQAIMAAGTHTGGAKGKVSKPSGRAPGKSKHKSGAGSDQRAPSSKGGIPAARAIPKASREEYLQTLVAAGRRRVGAEGGSHDLWPESTGRAGDQVSYDTGLPENPGDALDLNKVVGLAGNRARMGKAAEKHCLRELRDRRQRRRANSSGADGARGQSRSSNKESSTSSEEGEDSDENDMRDAKVGVPYGNQLGHNSEDGEVEEVGNSTGVEGANQTVGGAPDSGTPAKEEPPSGWAPETAEIGSRGITPDVLNPGCETDRDWTGPHDPVSLSTLGKKLK